MPTEKPLTRLEVAVLIYLSNETFNKRGWLRRGVRGWRLYGEVREKLATRISEVLPPMARRGLLDRFDLVEFARERPTLLYRISEAGERRLAELEDRPYEPIPLPRAGDRGGDLFVPASSWDALTVLRHYAENHIGPARFGAHGWMTAREVNQAQRTVRHGALTWLQRRGLAEVRSTPGESRPGGGSLLYRLTDPGMRTQIVDAVHSPGGRVELVEARVGEMAGPGRGGMRAPALGSGSRRASGASGRE